jgi:hypothetical protein
LHWGWCHEATTGGAKPMRPLAHCLSNGDASIGPDPKVSALYRCHAVRHVVQRPCMRCTCMHARLGAHMLVVMCVRAPTPTKVSSRRVLHNCSSLARRSSAGSSADSEIGDDMKQRVEPAESRPTPATAAGKPNLAGPAVRVRCLRLLRREAARVLAIGRQC